MNLNGKLFHQHDSDNLFDHTFIDFGLFNTDLQDELKMSVRKQKGSGAVKYGPWGEIL